MDQTIAIHDVISIDPEVVSGVPVFKGTRVPVKILFDHIQCNEPIEVFLEDFPTVTRKQVDAVLEITSNLVNSPDFLEK